MQYAFKKQFSPKFGAAFYRENGVQITVVYPLMCEAPPEARRLSARAAARRYKASRRFRASFDRAVKACDRWLSEAFLHALELCETQEQRDGAVDRSFEAACALERYAARIRG